MLNCSKIGGPQGKRDDCQLVGVDNIFDEGQTFKGYGLTEINDLNGITQSVGAGILADP